MASNNDILRFVEEPILAVWFQAARLLTKRRSQYSAEDFLETTYITCRVLLDVNPRHKTSGELRQFVKQVETLMHEHPKADEIKTCLKGSQGKILHDASSEIAKTLMKRIEDDIFSYRPFIQAINHRNRTSLTPAPSISYLLVKAEEPQQVLAGIQRRLIRAVNG